MSETAPLTPLQVAIQALNALLAQARIPHTFVGGVAASLLGRPRFTRDVDVLVRLDEGQWPDLIQTALQFGFKARRADALAFAARSRVLLLRHEATGIDVDVLLALLPIEESFIERSGASVHGGLSLRLPTPEDLIIMKSVSRRPNDQADIASIIDAHPNLDRAFLLDSVAGIAASMEDPAILEDLRRALDKRE